MFSSSPSPSSFSCCCCCYCDLRVYNENSPVQYCMVSAKEKVGNNLKGANRKRERYRKGQKCSKINKQRYSKESFRLK